MAATARLSRARLPWRTLTLCAIVLYVHAVPSWQAMLLFERDAILQGQLWRVLSGNIVHYSPMHLILNVSAMMIAAGIVELRGYRHYWQLMSGSALTIGCTVLALRPDIMVYAGLSGVVSASLTYLCLQGLYEDRVWRTACIVVLSGICLKLTLELHYDASVEQFFDTQTFRPVPLSHLAGALSGLGIFLVDRRLSLSPGFVLKD